MISDALNSMHDAGITIKLSNLVYDLHIIRKYQYGVNKDWIAINRNKPKITMSSGQLSLSLLFTFKDM